MCVCVCVIKVQHPNCPCLYTSRVILKRLRLNQVINVRSIFCTWSKAGGKEGCLIMRREKNLNYSKLGWFTLCWSDCKWIQRANNMNEQWLVMFFDKKLIRCQQRCRGWFTVTLKISLYFLHCETCVPQRLTAEYRKSYLLFTFSYWTMLSLKGRVGTFRRMRFAE